MTTMGDMMDERIIRIIRLMMAYNDEYGVSTRDTEEYRTLAMLCRRAGIDFTERIERKMDL